MIVITTKFQVRPEHADQWPDLASSFTSGTRAEPGCLWFSWSRSIDDPNEYVLIEAFRDDAAGAEHVGSVHFKTAQRELPAYLAHTPRIVNTTADGQEWSALGEFEVATELA